MVDTYLERRLVANEEIGDRHLIMRFWRMMEKRPKRCSPSFIKMQGGGIHETRYQQT